MAATYFNQIMGGGNELLPEFAPPSWKNLITMKHYIYIYTHFLILYLFEESLVTTVCLPHYRTFENELTIRHMKDEL